MGRLADWWAQAATQRADPFASASQADIHDLAGQAGPMDFADDVVLDPSETRWVGNAGGVYAGGFGGATPGGGGGGSWEQPYGGGAGSSWLYGGGGLFGQLDQILAMMGGGGLDPRSTGRGGPLSGIGTGSSTTGFTAAPSGKDFGGYDITPDDLVRWQGLLGIPEAIRTLRVAERRLGLPGLSDAVTGVGYRSHDQQAALYAAHLAGSHPAPVAPPGKSFHEQGEAFDISSAWLAANPTAQPWLERHGFTWDVPGEPWHAHYVGGGRPLFPQPATGNQGRPIPSESHRVSSPPQPRPESRAEFYRRRQGRY